MECKRKKFVENYCSMKKLKSKKLYGAAIFFIPVIPLILFIASIAMINKDSTDIANRVFGNYTMGIDTIASIFGISLTYFSILIAIMKYSYDRHKVIINDQKITTLIFRKNPFYGAEILLVIALILGILDIVNGFLNANLNSVAFSFLTISFDVTIYFMSYIIFANISSETLYYVYVLRPIINNVRMAVNSSQNKYIDICFEKIDEIITHICYDTEKDMHVTILNMLLEDLSKVRKWTIYEKICKRIRKINEVLDEYDMRVLQINRMLINYFDGLKRFERENAIKANNRYLKALKKKCDQKAYDELTKELDEHCQIYTRYFVVRHYPSFAQKIVEKFKVVD